MDHLSVVCKYSTSAYLLAGTLKCHSVVAINMALVVFLPLGFRKLRNGLDPVIKAMALILSILLSKLETHVVRKRELQ